MIVQALIGFLGGLITGISPCILPVLPVILFTAGAPSRSRPGTSTPTSPKATSHTPAVHWSRPYLVVGGLVLSFTAVTLAGSTLLTLLHLPQDLLRWAGLILLTLVGLGLLFPQIEHLLDRPFTLIRQRQVGVDRNGFLLGLALGAAYVPCAGPVLAAITVAGATSQVGLGTVFLSLGFAAGTAIPLLFFALAGKGITTRLKLFRERQRAVRITAGVTVLALVLGLAFDLPATLQRKIPDYTATAQKWTATLNQTTESGAITGCPDGSTALNTCGPLPRIDGITGWFNTPGNTQPTSVNASNAQVASPNAAPAPQSGTSQHTQVTLVDFWAYSCINCQRAIPGVQKLYSTYKDAGLQVIGVHSPEYSFEKVYDNVVAGAKKLGITYPVAVDSDLTTWQNFDNHYWPAQYLADINGQLRYRHFGEGSEQELEQSIRTLLTDANPSVHLPEPIFTGSNTGNYASDHTSVLPDRNPETYLGAQRAQFYSGSGDYTPGTHTFALSPTQPKRTFGLEGEWNIQETFISPGGNDLGEGRTATPSTLRLNAHAKLIQVVAAGTGTLEVTYNGSTRTFDISGTPNSIDIAGAVGSAEAGDQIIDGDVLITATGALELYSFTFG